MRRRTMSCNTQVSKTMRVTNNTSNSNHLSAKAVLHDLNANHLMTASIRNHVHQMLSKMMKTHSVLRYVVPLLKSASAQM